MPHTVCFGQTRKVGSQSTISVGGALYSVPSALVDERVWARADGSELVVVHADSPEGPREVARHELTTPGRPSIRDEHYPPRPAGALERRPRARSADERAFLQIGPGAERWLIAAAAVGTTRLRRKLAEAVALAKLHGADAIDEALGAATLAGRFGDGDLAAILTHRVAEVIEFPRAPQSPSRCSAPRAPGTGSGHDRRSPRDPRADRRRADRWAHRRQPAVARQRDHDQLSARRRARPAVAAAGGDHAAPRPGARGRSSCSSSPNTLSA